MVKALWNKLGRAARVTLVAGAAMILAATIALGAWLLRPSYEVLFSGLSRQDAAAVTDELDRQKVAYELDEQGGEDGGTTILVDRADVYRTRLKVMGRDLPLHGAVGFELFNNSDFGMTEFAQRINYQRALQGELTRTILSLAEVRDARVLLALPEQGLFKRERTRATASITLALRPGKTLAASQVSGIQRLVAAAIPGITSQDVTIVDQRGVALTRASGDGDGDIGTVRLDLKRDTEAYLTRKVAEVLDRTLGPGEALASVDVTLEMERVQTTTENVVAAPGAEGRTHTGVVVRERETVRDLGAPSGSAASVGAGAATPGGSSQREVEYAVGKRVEQVIGQPGAIHRIQAVAVVKKPLDPQQQEMIRRLVAASVGAVPERGDTVVVQPMDALAGPASADEDAAASEPALAAVPPGARPSVETGAPALLATGLSRPVLWGGTALVAFLFFFLAAVVLRRRGGAPSLSETERRAVLVQVQSWLRPGGAAKPGDAR